MQYTTHSSAETEQLAQQLLPVILNKRIVQLSGNLGSGKTTFVKGLAKALGIQKAVKSPTYTYLHKYEIRNSKSEINSHFEFQISNFRFLYHFDLYRLPSTSEHPEQVAASIGLEDALKDENGIVLIEWPERLPIEVPSLHLNFEKNRDHHQITTS